MSNRIYFQHALYFFLLASLLWACKKENGSGPSVSLLSITANSINLVEGTINVPTDATFELTFSTALNAADFEAAFSLTTTSGTINTGFTYTNASSKAIVTATNLESNTSYNLKIARVVIGQNSEMLDQAISINFTTVDGGIITEMAPCISASSDCIQTAVLTNGMGVEFKFDFYSSYPIYQENARWEKLKNVVLVTHGQNRNADDYFSYLMTTLRNENLDENTILIAPFFKNAANANAGDLYWNSSDWREGQDSDNPAGISSFEVVDQIIARLADEDHFPVLEKVLVTGHSSGALFTHVYAAANKAETLFPEIDFNYVVANSQYFYYPDDVRYDSSLGQFVAPTGCANFNYWPLGFVNPPAYLNGKVKSSVDQQFIERKVTYLLGTADIVTTGTLNTTDCEAVLLGANRFKRGEHIFSLLETNYSATHNSQKLVVPGVGHNAQGMYQSAAFIGYIGNLLN